jgi:hypothetical protein
LRGDQKADLQKPRQGREGIPPNADTPQAPSLYLRSLRGLAFDKNKATNTEDEMKRTFTAWAVRAHSIENPVTPAREFFVGTPAYGGPILFKTRAEARTLEPKWRHRWPMLWGDSVQHARAVKVRVTVEDL